VMHPVLTFGLPTRYRLTGSVATLIWFVFGGDSDLLCGRGALTNGAIGTFSLRNAVVEVV
jgi:hypothetical protein